LEVSSSPATSCRSDICFEVQNLFEDTSKDLPIIAGCHRLKMGEQWQPKLQVHMERRTAPASACRSSRWQRLREREVTPQHS